MSVPNESFPHRASADELLAHGRELRRLARALVGDAAADDVVQDAWVAALSRPPRDDRPTGPWLARVARNLAINKRRGEERRTRRELATQDETHAPASDEAALAIEAQRTLLDAVESLAEPLRSTVTRHWLEGRTSVEIARADGVAESTVRGRLAQALEELRRRLDARHGDRRTWIALVLPLARRAETTAAAGAGATTVGAVWITSTGAKLAVALAVAALVSVAAWELARNGDAPRAEERVAASAPTSVEEPASSSTSSLATETDAARTAIADTSSAAPTTTSAALAPARVVARVVDEHGAPIAGAELVCHQRVRNGRIASDLAPRATSGADGRVELRLTREDEINQPPGDWPETQWTSRVDVTAPAHVSVRREVELNAGVLVDLGDVVLAGGGDVTGLVVDETGRGIAGARVGLALPDMTGEERDRRELYGLEDAELFGEATSDADGRFAMRGVRAGFLRAGAETPTRLCAISEPFEVRAGETARVPELVLRVSPRLVRGRIVGADGAPCRASLDGALSSQRFSSNDGGSFQWSSAVAEDGTFAIDPRDAEALDLHAFRTPDKGGAIEAAVLRDVPAGTIGVLLRLEAQPVLELRVQDESGAPIAEFGYSMRESGGSGASVANLRDGRTLVRSQGLPFRLIARAQGFFERDAGRFTPETLPRELVVTLERVARVTGRVVSNGVPVAGARVSLHRVLPPSSTTCSNGFALRVEPDTFADTTSTTDGTFATTCPTDDRWVLVARKQGLGDVELEPMALGPRAGREGIEVELPPGGGVVGHVRGGERSGTALRWVTFSRGTGHDRSVPIAEDGSYAIDALGAGTWRARATVIDCTGRRDRSNGPPEPGIAEVVVAAGRTSVLDLEAPASKAKANESVELVGRLAFGATDPRRWTARLGLPPPDGPANGARTLERDGAFRLSADAEGKHRLRLVYAGPNERSDVVETEVELARGANAWTFDAPTGSIEGPKAPADELELAWESPSGVRWTTRVRGAREHALRLDDVPAGRVVIRAPDRIVAELDVVAGKTTSVAWR